MLPKNPHDKFVKDIMSDIDTARELLKVSLSEHLVKHLDWQSLAYKEGSFIDHELREYRSDALFTIRTKQGKPAQIYILFEHKSYNDANIHSQLLKYLSEIYRRQKQLSVVVPLVFYHGQEKWQIETRFIDRFRLDENDSALLGRYIPRFEYELNDLSQKNVDQLNTSRAIQIVLYLLKHIWQMNDIEKLTEFIRFAEVLFQENSLEKVLDRLLFYLYVNTDIANEQIIEIVAREISDEAGNKAMSTAEVLIKEGLEKGELTARLETARNMVQKSYSLEEICDITGLTEAQLKEHGVIGR